MKTVLFDMDGTLTEPRQEMNSNVLESLISLQNAGFRIGIVSGSGMNYIEEQCAVLFDINSFDFESVFWFPCNGTKHFKFLHTGKKETIYNYSMRHTTGEEAYKRIIQTILDSQIAVRYSLGAQDMPLTGTFIQYRGSMINWCPIGRDATNEDRARWVVIDKKHKIREAMLRRLRSFPVMQNLDIKLGGDTSFDIFPIGWDKTFVLKNFNKEDEVYFIGDRCGPSGNDKELYDAIKHRDGGESFETSGPMKTIELIEKLILEQRQQN